MSSRAEEYDRIIIGAGLYGLYAALFCAERGQRVVVLECDAAPFMRATTINQARVHQGYHYPRSISTAMKSAGYFERFNRDYSFCINKEFDQIYATSARNSWSDGAQFKAFCAAAHIPCEELHASNYFKSGMCDGVFRAREYAYDAKLLMDYLLDRLKAHGSAVSLQFGIQIEAIERGQDAYTILLKDGRAFKSGFALNVTYASTNQILKLAGFEPFKIKYELCELILCDVNDRLKGVGFTVMDGPFFSIVPYGKTGFHSLTSVSFTPHTTSYAPVPTFSCQARSRGHCSTAFLGNCNDCPARPETAYPYMSSLAREYMRDDYAFRYNRSMFSMKPILISSEIDDSRPTVIRKYSEHPTFVGVLSGKINTVYDLDKVLCDGE